MSYTYSTVVIFSSYLFMSDYCCWVPDSTVVIFRSYLFIYFCCYFGRLLLLQTLVTLICLYHFCRLLVQNLFTLVCLFHFCRLLLQNLLHLFISLLQTTATEFVTLVYFTFADYYYRICYTCLFHFCRLLLQNLLHLFISLLQTTTTEFVTLVYFTFTGYYCPAGSAAPTPCGAGEYTNQTRSTTCLSCPEGHYCPVNTSDPFPCPQGHWCGMGQSLPYVNPCVRGTFNNITGAIDNTHCLSCSPGSVWQQCAVGDVLVQSLQLLKGETKQSCKLARKCRNCMHNYIAVSRLHLVFLSAEETVHRFLSAGFFWFFCQWYMKEVPFCFFLTLLGEDQKFGLWHIWHIFCAFQPCLLIQTAGHKMAALSVMFS